MDENARLRRLLWLRHGCDFAALYGDDGEMQCNASGCHIDFKRDSAERIEQAFERRGRELLDAAAIGRPDAGSAPEAVR
jgi:hypothetical protein